MKAIIIGSGLSGLTAAATLSRAGHSVEVFEQNVRTGGVTQTITQDGFQWDLGQLLLEGLGEDEPVGRILKELGILDRIQIQKDDRGYIFPDFELRKPAKPAGPRWRIDRLRQIFPQESYGLERYWREYLRFYRVMAAARRMDTVQGLQKTIWQARLYWELLPLLPKKDWSAQRLMDSLFHSPGLQRVFISILADFFTSPSQFQGLGVYALNSEMVYDCRLPRELAPGAVHIYHYSILGGIGKLTGAAAQVVQKTGGQIYTGRAVTRIVVDQNQVKGIVDENGEFIPAEVVIASGGAKETFLELVGKEQLSPDYCRNIEQLGLMDSIFMLHLGVDYDPRPQVHGTCTYVYGNFNLEEAIQTIRDGVFHEGRDGYVIHIPSYHTPGMAPQGCHALTVYTIAPDRLKASQWEDQKQTIADRFLSCIEERLPGLRSHIRTRVILTPDDFRRIAHTRHHAFGGLAPLQGAWRPTHRTPVSGLWFVGAQSESGGGVSNVIPGGYKTAKKILQAVPK